jgi:hypothetical protein
MGSPCVAQQADPPGFNAQLSFVRAPDGSRFQVLTADGAATDQVATAAAYAAYVQAHPQPTPPGPTTVTKLGFLKLLTSTEATAFVVAQAQANALTAAQMAAPTPQQQALIGFQVFLMQYNALQGADVINLADPNTVAAVNNFLALGIVQSQARVTAILGGQPPAS